MTIEEIKISGLLELYALGQLSAREHAEVRQYLIDFPELKKELGQIEKALETYAHSTAVQPPAAVKERILKEIGSGQVNSGPFPSSTSGVSSIWRILTLLAALLIIGLIYFLAQKDKEAQAMRARVDVVVDSCAVQGQQYLAQIETLRQLTLPDNEIIHMAGTDKYPETDLYIHNNPVTKRNFIQIRNLPGLASNQSFQLWSLKPDTAPIPLDVFQQPSGQIIEVRHIDETQAYAITIEPLGGQDSPTLENLIGVANVGT